MKRYFNSVVDHPWVVIALALLITAFAAFQAKSVTVVIDITKMMPQSHPYVSTSTEVEHVFGSKHVVVVGISPKSGDIYQPAVLDKVRAMTDAFGATPGVVRENLLSLAARRAKDITGDAEGLSARQLLDSASANGGDAMARLRAAVQRNPAYQGTIVSADARMTSIIVEFSDEPTGFRTIMDKVGAIVDPARDDSVDIVVGGLPSFLAKVEIFSERMAFLLPIAILILAVILFEAFRTVQGMFLPLVTALLAVVWGVGVMGATGIPMDVFNATTPILILAVATGHSVQLLKRYYEEYSRIAHAEPLDDRAVNRRAIVQSLVRMAPVMLTAGCVASLGFFSLVIFEITTVRTFGIFTGVGILAALVLELSFVPALRAVLPPPRRLPDAGRKRVWARVMSGVATLVLGSRGRIFAVLALLLAVSAVGMLRIVEDNSVKRYFATDLPFQRDDEVLNGALGGTNTVYLLVEGSEADAIKDPSVLKAIDDLQTMLAAQPGVGKTLSIVDFLKRMNQAMQGDDPAAHVLPADRDLISQYLLLYSMSGEPGDFDSYVDYGYRQAKVVAFVKTDSTAYAENLIRRIEGFAAERFAGPVRLRIGGSAPQDVALNHAMVEDKILNIVQIAGVVLLVSSLVFRSLVAGLLVLLPLLVTVLINFGIMGWSGILLNIPTSLTSAMAVGIGADYAIYLIYRLREEFAVETDETLVVRRVLAGAGEAILFVAVAVACGYGVLLLSFGFHIHRWLALLIGSAMLVSASVALLAIPSLVLMLRPAFIFGRREPAAPALSAARGLALLLGAGTLALLALAPRGEARAAEPDATQVMEKNFMVSRVPDSVMDATFTLVNRSGQERVRKVRGATRLLDNGVDNMRITRFLAPSDVKGTVTLSVEHSDRDDDIWVYLPAMKKVRRLVASNKRDSFVGTDFSFGDVIGHRVADWKHRFLSDETVDGQPCFVVESLPRDDTVRANSGYARRLNWIRRDNLVTVRSEFWDENGNRLKTATFTDVRLVDPARARWQAMRLETVNHQTEHRSVIVFDEFRANQNLRADLFTTAAMEAQ